MVRYYVSNTGSDSANGTSESTPWQTISKINGRTFSAGDTISFKCGDVWREELDIWNRVLTSTEVASLYTQENSGTSLI